MAMVIFTLSVTISKIFIVDVCMTLTLTFRMGQDQMQLCQSKATYNMLFDGNSNFTIFVTISQIFNAVMCTTLTLTFSTGQGQK